MWLFILFVTNVIRADLFGRRVTAEELVAANEQASSISKPSGRLSALRNRSQNKQSAPPAPPTRVVITTGKGAGATAQLPQLDQEIVLGRAASSDLDLDDDYASSRHAKIWRDAQGFVVEDLNSTNGTYVNGQRITQPTRIAPGDIVRIGRSQMQLDG